MEVLIDRLDHQGRGITTVDGKITFVENALPGEAVDIKIVKSEKKINEAVLEKIIEKSLKRVEPICPYYNECGGCSLMHLSYDDNKLLFLVLNKKYSFLIQVLHIHHGFRYLE